ncbi:hypothetical protein OB2597_07215 [Pseudooceanicola batsensis HTCC2597]|uniref:DUF1150 family protein n=1 Tax=Pseudooceanicola batsensis (strain ATCC BAA-863 / DSM 15984 / KCTC 12145 / HTCC2597) TaxID=252305 RepID=A3TTS8_PSEBH|nr:DUF1150 family protein [Pseudooceanicola batsensis]EAQ05055.1 hypothetical protein OB2597_07215 [Pseudooceanicola batsensis HTCC2597]
MNTSYEIAEDARPIVYVRAVKVADLPEDVQAQVEGLDELYAVHDSSGERLALVKDRDLAFVLARQNEMEPVTVH